jgi:hypothetical protein
MSFQIGGVKVYNEKETAFLLGIKYSTLRSWRVNNSAPVKFELPQPYKWRDRFIVYKAVDVDAHRFRMEREV